MLRTWVSRKSFNALLATVLLLTATASVHAVASSSSLPTYIQLGSLGQSKLVQNPLTPGLLNQILNATITFWNRDINTGTTFVALGDATFDQSNVFTPAQVDDCFSNNNDPSLNNCGFLETTNNYATSVVLLKQLGSKVLLSARITSPNVIAQLSTNFSNFTSGAPLPQLVKNGKFDGVELVVRFPNSVSNSDLAVLNGGIASNIKTIKNLVGLVSVRVGFEKPETYARYLNTIAQIASSADVLVVDAYDMIDRNDTKVRYLAPMSPPSKSHRQITVHHVMTDINHTLTAQNVWNSRSKIFLGVNTMGVLYPQDSLGINNETLVPFHNTTEMACRIPFNDTAHLICMSDPNPEDLTFSHFAKQPLYRVAAQDLESGVLSSYNTRPWYKCAQAHNVNNTYSHFAVSFENSLSVAYKADFMQSLGFDGVALLHYEADMFAPETASSSDNLPNDDLRLLTAAHTPQVILAQVQLPKDRILSNVDIDDLSYLYGKGLYDQVAGTIINGCTAHRYGALDVNSRLIQIAPALRPLCLAPPSPVCPAHPVFELRINEDNNTDPYTPAIIFTQKDTGASVSAVSSTSTLARRAVKKEHHKEEHHEEKIKTPAAHPADMKSKVSSSPSANTMQVPVVPTKNATQVTSRWSDDFGRFRESIKAAFSNHGQHPSRSTTPDELSSSHAKRQSTNHYGAEHNDKPSLGKRIKAHLLTKAAQ